MSSPEVWLDKQSAYSGIHSTTIKPSNVDAGWGPKYFWFYRDIWRSSDVATNSFLSIEIYTIRYLAICDCLQLDSKPKIFLKLREKHGDSTPFQLHCPDCGLPFNSSGTLAVSVVTVNF